MPYSSHAFPEVQGRFFIVGCERSGTTLLQSLLAAHPEIASFPETDFFTSLIGYLPHRVYGAPPKGLKEWMQQLRSEMRLHLGIAASYGDGYVRENLQKMGEEDLFPLLPKGRALWPKLRAVATILDRMAQKQNRSRWIEKTPQHLAYIDFIEKVVARPCFIHLVRNGEDVVASIYDASRKYDFWAQFYPGLDACIRQWNHCLTMTRRDAHKPNHLVVRYEQLVEETAGVVQAVCRFLEIDYHEEMLHSYTSAFNKIARPDEPWKAGVQGEIKNANGSKFSTLFDAEQQRYIREHLTPLQDNEFYVTLADQGGRREAPPLKAVRTEKMQN